MKERIKRGMNTVIFDMDGVLFNTERLITDCWYKTAKEWGIKEIDKAISQCMGLNENDTKKIFYEIYGQNFPVEKFKKVTSDLFYDEIEKNGVPVMKGVYEILDYLKEKGYKIGIASSTKEKSVRRHLENAKILNYFEVIVTGDMVEHSKPHPEIYLLAVEKLKSEKEKTVAVEDSFHGITSAYRAGIKPIMIPDMVQPTEEIKKMLFYLGDDLLKLKEIL